MSIRVTLNCLLKAGQITSIMPFLEENLPNVRGFKGCLGVSVYFDIEQGEMLLEEEWMSVAAHQTYIESIQASGVLAELAAFFEAPPSIKYFDKKAI